MKRLFTGISCLFIFCLLQVSLAYSAGPYWQGLSASQPTWQQWTPASPLPVVATTSSPESVMLALAEATTTSPAYLYSLHKIKPSGIASLLQKRDWKSGVLVTTFGSNGTKVDELTTNHYPKNLVVGGDGYLYVLYSDADGTSGNCSIQKRNPTTGSLVSTFAIGNISFQKMLPLPGTDGLVIVTKGTNKYTASRYSYSAGTVLSTYDITTETENILKNTYFGDATLSGGYLYTSINIKNIQIFPPGWDQKYRITKTAAISGVKQWEQTYDNSFFSKEQASSLAVDSSGIYLAGANTSGIAMFNVTDNFVRKYDTSSGILLTNWGLDGTVKIPFLSMFFQTVEQLTLRVTENTIYLLNNGTSSSSFFIFPLSSSSSATLSRINKTTGVPDSSFADSGLAKVAKGKFPYFLLDKWGGVGIIGSNSSFIGDYIAKLGIPPIPYGLVDSGIRYKTATGTVSIAAEPVGFSSSPLRIRKNGTTYSLPLVEADDPASANILIQSPLGVKSLTKSP